MKYKSLVNETEKALQEANSPGKGKGKILFIERAGPDTWEHNGNIFRESTIEEAMDQLPGNTTILIADFGGGEWPDSPMVTGKNDLNDTEIPIHVPKGDEPMDLQPLPPEEPSEEDLAEGTFDENWMNKR